MGLNRVAKFVGIGIVLVVVIILAGAGFVMYDVMSYTATGSQTLNPSGNVVGNALVVYDPGITGTAKNASAVIANDLQAKGYKVTLAGIKSTEAATTSGYDVIVITGPVYGEKITNTVQSYLNALKPSENTKIGVLTTGGVQNTNDTVLIQKEVNLPSGSTFKIDDIMKLVSGNDVNKTTSEFVDSLLK